MFVSFNETIWWVFDRGTIAEVCVPKRDKGMTESWEEESDTCSTCGGWSQPTAGGWLAGDVAAPLEGEMEMAATEESMGKRRLGSAAKGEKSFDGRRLWYQVNNN